jgi:hypothetical protein
VAEQTTIEREATKLSEAAAQRWGAERAEAIRALGLGLPTGLAIVATAELGDAEEPDFLPGGVE